MEPLRPETPAELVSFFTRLWLKAEPVVSAFIFGTVRDFHDAEDLIQTVAVDAAAAIETYDRSRPFEPWIMGIARNRVLKHFRNNARHELVFDAATLESIAGAYEAIGEEVDDRRRLLRDCIARLADRAREVVRLRYEEGLAAAVIAERLRLSANAVYVTLHRAREALSQCIESEMKAEGDRRG